MISKSSDKIVLKNVEEKQANFFFPNIFQTFIIRIIYKECKCNCTSFCCFFKNCIYYQLKFSYDFFFTEATIYLKNLTTKTVLSKKFITNKSTLALNLPFETYTIWIRCATLCSEPIFISCLNMDKILYLDLIV